VRRLFVFLSPLLLAAVCTQVNVRQVNAQQAPPPLPDFSKVQVETQKVAGNVYMLVGAGGNIAVSAGDDGVLMVDTEYPPLFDRIEAALHKLSDKPLRFVIDTHWHLDHASGNENFTRAGAIIVAQENVRRILASGTVRDGVKYPPFPKDDLPTVLYDDHTTIFFNGEPVKLVHYPNAHTDGDTVVYFANSHVIDTGDNYRTDGFPLVDQDNGGSVEGIIAALDNIMETYPPDTKVIPGHGPTPMTVADIKSFADMLRDCRARVEKGIAAGKTVEQMKQEKILAGYEKYSARITSDRFTEMLYRELTEKKSTTR
jgi:glyoxylase-like metal-dependent hydrolase (beta-lactamase superfamily II)